MNVLRAGGAEAFVAALEARLFPVLHRISEEPHMAAVRDAMAPSFVGLIVVTIVAFFIPPEWALHQGIAALTARFFAAYHIGFGAMGVAVVILLADRLARTFTLNRVLAGSLSLAAFGSALHWPLASNLATELGNISSTSILLGLAVALAVGEALRLSRLLVRNALLSALIGSLGIVVIFGSLALAHVSIGDALLTAIRPLVAVGDTLPALLIVILLQTLLWTAGVHGPALLSGIVTPVFLKALDENGQAFVHHQPAPHIVTLMLAVFYYPGGSGATLPLSLLMLRSRIPRLRKLGIASILPSLCNVNEVLIFGLPLVMNPSLTIPFLCAPVVLGVVTYALMWAGVVGRTLSWWPPLLPSFISGWLTTNYDLRAVALVALNVAIGMAIYLPFFRAYEKTVLAEPVAQERLLKMAEAIREHERELEQHPELTAQQHPEPTPQQHPEPTAKPPP